MVGLHKQDSRNQRQNRHKIHHSKLFQYHSDHDDKILIVYKNGNLQLIGFDLSTQDKYFIYLRGLKKSIEIYREENIPLFVEMETKQQGKTC